MNILVLNGPNLNLLGTREPDIYGNDTLEDIQKYTEDSLKKMGHEPSLTWKQFNSEEKMINAVQETINEKIDALVINPGAFSHTSLALLDALQSISIPIIEVHISNTCKREEIRQRKLTAKAATSIMEGLGKNAYLLGILSLMITGESNGVSNN